jgi:hypothetical protein
MNIRSESHTKVSPKSYSRTLRAKRKNGDAKQQVKPLFGGYKRIYVMGRTYHKQKPVGKALFGALRIKQTKGVRVD